MSQILAYQLEKAKEHDFNCYTVEDVMIFFHGCGILYSKGNGAKSFWEILAGSSYVVFLGGAGVSTESGIPDFRSKDGLYNKTKKRFSKCRPEYDL